MGEPTWYDVILNLVLRDAAKELAVPMPVLDLVRAQYEEAMKKGWKDKDWASIAQLSLEKAGL